MKYSILIRIIALLGISLVLVGCGRRDTTQNQNTAATMSSTQPVQQAQGSFNEYPLPQGKNGIMRPVVDQQQRIWFGEMGRNHLTYFDPTSKSFHQLTIPDGQGGIMGIAVGPDGSIWYAEQNANYIGRYDSKNNHFTTYALPEVTTKQSETSNKTIKLPVAPNELVFDQQGNLWFTEMNADAIGKLNPGSGSVTSIPLSSPSTVQQLNPYGIAIDREGMIWFTEAGKGAIGRYNPQTRALRTYSEPGGKAGISFMEVTSDPTGKLWLTTFNSSALIQFDPQSDIFTAYPAETADGGVSGIYGITMATDRQIWLTIPAANAIAHFNTQTKLFQYYKIPTNSCTPLGIVLDQHNTIWFSESATDQLGSLQP